MTHIVKFFPLCIWLLDKWDYVLKNLDPIFVVPLYFQLDGVLAVKIFYARISE